MAKANQILVLFVLLFSLLSHSQDRGQGSKILDKLLAEKKIEKADSVLNATISELTAKKDYYYLSDMVFYVGKIQMEKSKNKVLATKSVTDFIGMMLKTTDSLKVLRSTYLTASQFYEFIGENQKAYDANIKALKITKKWGKARGQDFGVVENNLSSFCNRMGNIQEGNAHAKKAMQYFESDPKTDKKDLYNSYNNMAVAMWQVSKVDSALYYFKKYETVLNTLDKTPENIYGQAYLQNNIAAIYGTQGNLELGLQAMQTTVNCLNNFIKSDIPDKRREQAKNFLYAAIDNYGLMVKQTGDYQKALDLFQLCYNLRVKNLGPNHPHVFESKIKLGQMYLDLNEYTKANKFLNDAIAQIHDTPGDNYIYDADAHFAKASVCEALDNVKEAQQHFEEAERLYELALQGAYDEVYLKLIEAASNFYAQNNNRKRALSMAQKAYDYIKANQGVTSSFEIQQTLSLGDLYFQLEDYPSALEKSKQTLELLKTVLPTQTNLDNSAVIFKYYPPAVLLNTKTKYQLQTKKTASFLKELLDDLNKAIQIIEQKRTTLDDMDNVSLLIADNNSVFEYAKKLSMDLYELTDDKTYLNNVIGLNESILYNKIRSRLNAKTSFRDVPVSVLAKEKTIKTSLTEALTSNNMEHYFSLEKEWKDYLDMMKSNYPKYYKLRFASISKSLEDLSNKVPDNSTIVRYTYIDDQLYAIVITKETSKTFKINQDNLSEKISKFQDATMLMQPRFEDLHQLYNQLWKPFENDITTEKVIIIPERELFNLSFEMLTPKRISAYKKMATTSLLSKYVISYNYSLFLLDTEKTTLGYKDDFIAFVPEFDDKMKEDYKISIKDSLALDKTYLTLLPQPFTKILAENSARLFNGSTFLNEKSTEHIFKNSAKEHKIIHIGTHAESNNISPELSRLVFAKSADSPDADDNYLYTYEIYNTNLSSNLAILTACETGKPTYQAGEGMISLAHAFNYAGSESILTSLWKIDEQSSAQIIELFYENIKKGMPKDKALQQAKLAYISKAEGRTVNPEYWAGLVLIGDTSPIILEPSHSWIYWIVAGLAVFAILIFILRRKPSQ